MTCDKQEKNSSWKVILWFFLQIRNLIWTYTELTRLLVGSGLIPLNIELQQDDRTVCCGHNTVQPIYWWTLRFQCQALTKVAGTVTRVHRSLREGVFGRQRSGLSHCTALHCTALKSAAMISRGTMTHKYVSPCGFPGLTSHCLRNSSIYYIQYIQYNIYYTICYIHANFSQHSRKLWNS